MYVRGVVWGVVGKRVCVCVYVRGVCRGGGVCVCVHMWGVVGECVNDAKCPPHV